MENLRRTKLLDAQTSKPLAHIDGLGKRAALDDTSGETTSKGVTGAVGVADLRARKLVNGVLLDLILTLDGHEGGQGAVGDDGNALALSVGLGKVGELLGNLLEVLGAEIVRVRKGLGLTLVANNVVPVRGRIVKGPLEELADEGGREGEDEGLVLLSGVLGELLDSRGADSQVVATDIEGLGVLDEGPDLWALEMVKVVVVGGAKIGDHAAVVAGDDNTATAGGDLGVDTVLDAETSLLNGIAKDGSILVVTNATKVDDAVLGENVLSTTSSVLGGTTSDQLGIVLVEKLLVDGSVLSILRSQDGVVGLEVVLLQEGTILIEGLNICFLVDG